MAARRVFLAGLALVLVFAILPGTAAAAEPAVTAVQPNPVPAKRGRQDFVVIGSGFQRGAVLTLTDLTRNRVYADRATGFLGASRLLRLVNFGDRPGRWRVAVRNPDGQQSAAFDFAVGPATAAAPPPAVPRPAPPPPPAVAPLQPRPADTAAQPPPAQVAGEIVLLTGQATALAPDGTVRALARGNYVHGGEVVTTALNTYVNLRFTDGGLVLLRPNTRFQIEEYRYLPTAAPVQPGAAAPVPSLQAGSGSNASFRLLRGGLRTVTGLIGKVDRDQYRVSTPAATIGIRGTDYLIILCDAACSVDPVISTSLPPGGDATGGVVIGVISGGIFLASEAGAALGDVDQDQYTLALPDGNRVNLPFEPRFLRVDPIPNPQTCVQ